MIRTYEGKKQSALKGSEPQYFYSVPCSSCGATEGEPCREALTYARSRRKKWALPHKSRVARRLQIEELQG